MAKKILLLEDEKMILDSYVDALKKKNYEVFSVTDGYQGLDILEENRDEISLIILDLMIPGLDGLSFLRFRGENPEKYGNAPVLVLTNMAVERVIKEAFDLGAVSYLIKNEMPLGSLCDEVKKIIED